MVIEITQGVKVMVETEYQPSYSSPSQYHYVFTYKITIENVKQLAVNGAGNQIDVGGADKIAVVGSDNKITYKKGLSGTKPKVGAVGKNNKIDQVK